jgi:hypothetical protein
MTESWGDEALIIDLKKIVQRAQKTAKEWGSGAHEDYGDRDGLCSFLQSTMNRIEALLDERLLRECPSAEPVKCKWDL